MCRVFFPLLYSAFTLIGIFNMLFIILNTFYRLKKILVSHVGLFLLSSRFLQCHGQQGLKGNLKDTNLKNSMVGS